MQVVDLSKSDMLGVMEGQVTDLMPFGLLVKDPFLHIGVHDFSA